MSQIISLAAKKSQEVQIREIFLQISPISITDKRKKISTNFCPS